MSHLNLNLDLDLGTSTLLYKKELRAIAGSTSATILLHQMLYWWAKFLKPFYKFISPPTSIDEEEKKWYKKWYKEGQSWEEELGFSSKEFRSAFKILSLVGVVSKKRNSDRITHYTVYPKRIKELMNMGFVYKDFDVEYRKMKKQENELIKDGKYFEKPTTIEAFFKTYIEEFKPKVEAPKVETPEVETPKVETPKVEAPKVETPKVETPKVETPKVETPKVETPKVEAPKVEAPKVEKVLDAHTLLVDGEEVYVPNGDAYAYAPVETPKVTPTPEVALTLENYEVECKTPSAYIDVYLEEIMHRTESLGYGSAIGRRFFNWYEDDKRQWRGVKVWTRKLNDWLKNEPKVLSKKKEIVIMKPRNIEEVRQWFEQEAPKNNPKTRFIIRDIRDKYGNRVDVYMSTAGDWRIPITRRFSSFHKDDGYYVNDKVLNQEKFDKYVFEHHGDKLWG